MVFRKIIQTNKIEIKRGLSLALLGSQFKNVITINFTNNYTFINFVFIVSSERKITGDT